MNEILCLIKEKIEDLSKFQIALMSCLGSLIILGGVYLILVIPRQNNDLENLESSEEYLAEELELESFEMDEAQVDLAESVDSFIYVDIKGAVYHPGVKKMSINDRMVDVIEIAGGFTAEADQKQINLAQKLEDQMLIIIPEIGEEPLVQNAAVSTPGQIDSDQAGLVNINSADRSLLMTLHGIGEAKAQAIINYREEHGSFQTIEEIKNVSGIGEGTFSKLKEYITVD